MKVVLLLSIYVLFMSCLRVSARSALHRFTTRTIRVCALQTHSLVTLFYVRITIAHLPHSLVVYGTLSLATFTKFCQMAYFTNVTRYML
jgi:hypothetical protein